MTEVLPGLVVMGLGLGLTFMPLTMLATYGVRRRGCRVGLGAAQCLAAGRRARWARRPVDARRPHVTSHLAGLGHAPTPLDAATAAVSGYRAAFIAGAALMMLVGAICCRC